MKIRDTAQKDEYNIHLRPNSLSIVSRISGIWSPTETSRKREILMAYPAATVRIEKTDESGRAK